MTEMTLKKRIVGGRARMKAGDQSRNSGSRWLGGGIEDGHTQGSAVKWVDLTYITEEFART